jgi:hypothetical protein
MHGFIYEWTNTSNGLKYIGRHQGTPNDGYIGSGTVFRNSYNKHPETYVRSILWESSDTSSDELKSKEEEFLNAITDDELYYGSDRKYYNQVRNSAGYTSEENPMRNPEVVARVLATKTADGTLSSVYANTVAKYGKETVSKMNARPGNTYGSGNKGSIKTETHKTNISNSIAKMYASKKESDKYIAPTGRPKTVDYSIILTTVQQKGFKVAATELGLSVSTVKSRYYDAKSKINDLPIA